MLIRVLDGILRNIVTLVVYTFECLRDGLLKKTIRTTNFENVFWCRRIFCNLLGALSKIHLKDFFVSKVIGVFLAFEIIFGVKLL